MNYTFVVTLMLWAMLCGTMATAQTSLELTDKLPPYLLSARLLNNGHFSITTRYTQESKTLIYREDGTGNRPVNYTSHIHVKIDDIVYQLPFEVDRTTDLPPPPNPLKVLRLFADTVNGRPRINALLLAVTPSGDSVRTTFTMEPVQRPSGGFIRLSAAVENAGFNAHNVGVLMLIDTKIGNNDRASIGTAFGYSGVESEFRKTTAPGIPEFWVAFEGTPLSPGLTARGNLRESELIEPDRFLFGNWVDDNSTGTPGLYRVMWDERVPSGLSFTDSAILLLWEQQQLARATKKLLAATEIGIVDSLIVTFGSGGGSGGGGGGGSIGVAGPGACIKVATATEGPCGLAGYQPYDPDVVASLFLVTNTGTTTLNGMQALLGALPPGIRASTMAYPVIPGTLTPNQTGVSVVPVVAIPRLYSTSYQVPVAFVNGQQDTIHKTHVCIEVPGILASIDAKNTQTLPVCPGDRDTFAIPIELKGIRCLPVYQATIVSPATAPAAIVGALPLLPADGIGYLQVESAPLSEQTTDVRIRVVVRDWESLTPGDTTWVEIVDTVTVTIIGKHAEVQALVAGDTLVLPRICVRDIRRDSMQIQNIGGCNATLATVRMSNDAGGVFSIGTETTIPQTIARGERGQVYISATSATAGTFIGEIEITSVAKPGTIRVPVKIVVDQPSYSIPSDTLFIDTVCPNVSSARTLRILNNTGCDVRIDSVRSIGVQSLGVSPAGGFLVGARSNVSVALSASPTFEGPFETVVRVYSQESGDRDVVVIGYSANRSLDVTASIDAGRCRVNRQTALTGGPITVTNLGSAPITITAIRISGQHPQEFTVSPSSGQPLPITIPANGTLLFDVGALPTAIGNRTAIVLFETEQPLCNPMPTVTLVMYGVQPLVDVEKHDVQRGNVCLGGTADTVVVLRNLGNEPYNVESIQCIGSTAFVLTKPAPFTVDSGESVALTFQFTPSRIGQETCECFFETDGDWFTPTDTTLRLGVTGIVCGTLWADTVTGYVGTLAPVQIHFLPDERTQLTQAQLMQAIADHGAPIELSVSISPDLARISEQVGGGMQGAVVTQRANGISMRVPTLPNNGAALFADLQADVLLGSLNRSVIRVELLSMANGMHDVQVHDGLIRSEYCAFDQRRVNVVQNGVGIVHDGNGVRILGFENTFVTVQWFTVHGSMISEYTAGIDQGSSIDAHVPEKSVGVLLLVVTTSKGVQTARILAR